MRSGQFMPMITVEQLCESLTALVRGPKGVERFEIRNQAILLKLECIRQVGKSDDTLRLENAFREVLMTLCRALQPQERAMAALSLFGLAPAAQGRNLKVRRTLAAEALGYLSPSIGEDKRWDAFRKRYEKDLIRDAAAELYLHELELIEHRAQPIVPSVKVDEARLAEAPPLTPLQEEEVPAPDEEPRTYAEVGAAFTYIVRGDDYRSHAYIREFEIEAVRQAPRPFKHWYKWSGTGTEGPPVVTSSGHHALGEPFKADNLTYLYVHLGEDFHIGQRTTVRIQQDLYDSERTFEPILSSSIHDVGQEWLTLRVMLPTSRPPAKVWYSIWTRHHDMDVLVSTWPGTYQQDIELNALVIEWSPETVRWAYRYTIQWSYEDGDSIYPGDVYDASEVGVDGS